MSRKLSQFLSSWSIEQVSKLYRLDFTSCDLHFTDINHTDFHSLSFWDGSHLITKTLFGHILVSSAEHSSLLNELYSSYFSDSLRIVVCNAPLPLFFWQFLSEVIPCHEDCGSLAVSGDQYTSFPSLPAWVSSFASIGHHVRIGPQSLIGCTGIATFESDDGSISDIPHLGRVVLSNNVRLSSNVVVSRGILSDTYIGSNTVVGTGCIIGHNVVIGDNCFIGPNVILNGSCIIGSCVTIGAGSVVCNGVSVPSHSYISAGSVVSKSFQKPVHLVGNPSRSIPFME